MTYFASTLEASDNLTEWDLFVEHSPQGSLFCKSWWLRAVCPEGFQILVLTKGTKIVAGIPLPHRYFLGQNIEMPQLTQTLGVLLEPSHKAMYEGRLTEEIEKLKALLTAMPLFRRFSMNFHYNFTNWLPLYWKGYRQTTYYTYILEPIKDLEHIFSRFTLSKRKRIEKTGSALRVSTDMRAEDFYNHHALALRKEGKKIDYSLDFFKRIYGACREHSAGTLWSAADDEGNVHAAICVVYDRKSAYYLISSIDPDYRQSGAVALLVQEAITCVSRYTDRFDFEGSMIPGVEHSFRKFGAVQTPYFHISKDNRTFLVKSAEMVWKKMLQNNI